MYVIYTKLKNFNTFAPSAWFIEEQFAKNYADYLMSIGSESKVVLEPDMYLKGKERGPKDFSIIS